MPMQPLDRPIYLIDTQTLEYGISESDVRSLHPNTSFPVPFVPPAHLQWVYPTQQPAHDKITHYAVEIAPERVRARNADGTLVSDDPETDADEAYVWAQQWRIDPAPPEHVIAAVKRAVQKRLDDFAVTRGYDGILSVASYATDPNPKFSAEGQYAVQARGATWAACYAIMAAVQAGERPMPATIQEVFDELPALEWPAAPV